MIIQQIRNEAKKPRYSESEETAFTEGAIYGINSTLDEAILLLQAKFGYDDIYFEEARKILSSMRINLNRYSINPDNDGQQ